ncbi:MAG TPA: FAD binding domain-containing protein [Burkholderiaceae bacterium]|nr:FAD binding domain-containing protein [Burkholderiaceae bacterium]
MSPFVYRLARSIEEASAILAGAGDEARLLAGGMTLIPAMKHGLAAPSTLVDLRAVASLKGIAHEGAAVVIGAMTTHDEVAASAAVRAQIPALAGLAGGIGDPQVRRRGTIGGSVANNDPAADYPAACMGLGATIVTNRRAVPADEFFSGFFSTALGAGELVTAVRFPVPQTAAYIKFANQASRYATVGVFVSRSSAGVRLAVTGAGRNGVFRVRAIEEALMQRFSPGAVPGHGLPDDALFADLHASAAYRSHLIDVLARRAVAACLGITTKVPVRHGGAVAY